MVDPPNGLPNFHRDIGTHRSRQGEVLSGKAEATPSSAAMVNEFEAGPSTLGSRTLEPLVEFAQAPTDGVGAEGLRLHPLHPFQNGNHGESACTNYNIGWMPHSRTSSREHFWQLSMFKCTEAELVSTESRTLFGLWFSLICLTSRPRLLLTWNVLVCFGEEQSETRWELCDAWGCEGGNGSQNNRAQNSCSALRLDKFQQIAHIMFSFAPTRLLDWTYSMTCMSRVRQSRSGSRKKPKQYGLMWIQAKWLAT